MAQEESRVQLEGSTRSAPLHERVGAPDPVSTATITVYLRASAETPAPGRLSREEYAANYGASQADVVAVRSFAESHGLTVGEVDTARRSVQLTGRLRSLTEAFGTAVSLFRAPDGTMYRGREGALSVPSELSGIILGVFGLDERPQSQAHFRPTATAAVQYTPPQVASAYAYPNALTGSGECIGIIELGGGFRTEDIAAYFSSLNIAAPRVVAVQVDNASNQPGTPNGPDGEVMLDIEVAGSVAPGVAIAVYFAPNTEQGFIDAATTAVHDTTNRPTVVSISWGGPESTWTAQAMNQMEQAFAAAAAMAVTVTVAAGDNGSTASPMGSSTPTSRPRLRTLLRVAARACGSTAPASRRRRYGTMAPAKAQVAEGSVMSSRYLTIRPRPRFRRPPTRAAGWGVAFRTSAGTPIRTRGTPSGSTAKP